MSINIIRLLGTPSVVEWPDIANCLYYQTCFPNFPLNGVELSQLSMSKICQQFLAVKTKSNDFLCISFVCLCIMQDILIYNPQTRPTAKQLIDKHPYFYGQSSLNLEKPVRSIIDRAVRLQTESLKNTIL